MRLLAFSDLHLSESRSRNIVEAAAEADLVIGAGDFCNGRQGLDRAMDLLSGVRTPIVAVPGNAESVDELRAVAPPNMTVLHGEETNVDGVKIFGLGYGVPVTPFGDWSCDLTEDAAGMLLNHCKSADILVSHSPPYGVSDMTSGGTSVGSTAVLAATERLQPSLLLCGHIHDCWGVRGMIGKTQVVNLGPFPNWFEVEA